MLYVFFSLSSSAPNELDATNAEDKKYMIAPYQIKIKEIKPVLALQLDIIFHKGISANFFSTPKKIN
jgi:hypothetical protein